VASELPLWYARERGVDLSSMVSFEDEDAEQAEEEDDMATSALGTVTTAVLIALGALAMVTSGVPLWATVLVGIAGAAWLALAFAALWNVAASEEPAPWAAITFSVTAGIGRLVVVTMIVAAIAAVIAVVLAFIAALAGDRR